MGDFGGMGANVRRIAVAVALVSTVLAISLIAVAFSRTSQRTGAFALFQAAGRGVQYYFIPASQAKKLAAQQQHLPTRLDQATAEPKPKYAVFNTGAEVREPAAHSSAAIKKAAKRMQLPDNFVWGKNGKGLDPEFVCTKDNLIALYNFVQPEWEKCKDSVNYIQSNKCADPTTPGCESMLAQSNTTEAASEQQSSPSVLGWISKEVAHDGPLFTPEGMVKYRRYKAQAQRFIKHKLLEGPTAVDEIQSFVHRNLQSNPSALEQLAAGSHSRRLLGRMEQLTYYDKAPVNDTSSPTMKQCIDFAMGHHLCAMLDSCDDPVCDR